MGPDGLTRRDRDIIRDALAHYPEVRLVTLFGSRAMGTFGCGSDIDLALEGPDLDSPTLTRIAIEVEDSDLPYQVDLLLRDDQLEPKLEAHIRRYGKPFGWRPLTLCEVTSWRSGGTPSKSNFDFWGGTIPWVSAKSIKNFYLHDSEDRVTEAAIANGARLAEPGDILMLVRGMTLHNDVPIGIAMRPMTFNQDVKAIRGTNGADTRFIAYWLLAHKRNLLAAVDQSSHGTGRLQTDVLHAMQLQLPPEHEQRAIAGVLGALDDKIEQNRQTAQALERLAQAIFRAWFVDFEPVKAKAAGAASFASMPKAVFDALPTRFADSVMRPVPEGWRVGNISGLAELSKMQVNPQKYPEELFEHFSIPAFDAGQCPLIEVGSAIKSNKFLVTEGCLLVSKLNPRIPRVWLPQTTGLRRQIASTEFLVLMPRTGYDRHYVYCQSRQPEFRDDLKQHASGTSNSHQRIRPSDLLAKHVLSPPTLARDGFRKITAPLFAMLASSEVESRKLVETRDYLLAKLLSGEVRVRDAKHRAAAPA